MKKNGFTLIELLAVIVILAIIALIATPIILGIINDAREKANERSVELYASAIRNGIAAYQLREMKEVAAGSYTSETLPFDVEYDGDVECSTIELYQDGGVYVTGCTVNDVEVEYAYGTKQVAKGTMGICNPLSVQTEGTYTAGDKYECDVDPNKEGYDYIFYVLTTPSEGATSVNLIMDSNIRTGGEAVKEANPTEAQRGLVEWISKNDYTREDIGGTEVEYGSNGNWDKGPITAMEYLQEATKDWTNVNLQTINSFDSCDYKGICETQNMAKTYIMNARLPYLSEVSGYDGTNAYLFNNLHFECYDDECVEYLGVHEEGMTHVYEVRQYYTLSVLTESVDSVFTVRCPGHIVDLPIGEFGVRPVINLSI